MTVENLIFDVGDVLLGYRWQEMFADFGISSEDGQRVGNEIFESKIWYDELDCGFISVEEAIKKYRGEFPNDIGLIERFLRNAGEMVVPRPEVWEKMAELKNSGYKLYLLSNYSQELFDIHTDGADFLELIDGEVISYQVHIRKPDRRIYKALLEKYHLSADSCLFFDDRKENVGAAVNLGIKSVHITSRKKINEELNKIIVGGNLL